jgi:hypothetical protein
MLPPEIRVEQCSPGEVCYVLPRRPLGAYRWLAVAPLAFALVGASFFWGWFAALAQAPLPVLLIFGGIGGLFAVGAVAMPLAISGAMLFGHSSVEIRRARLFAVEHIGPLRWRRQRPLAQIRRLEVSSPNNRSAAQRPSSPSRFAAIRVETERKKPMFGAIGYPREWLLPLAHELARQAAIVGPAPAADAAFSTGLPAAPKPIEVADDLAQCQRSEQPPGSRIVMTEQPGSMTFEIPPGGMKGGAKALFLFACVWLVFMAVFTTAMILGFSKQQPPQIGGLIFGSLFLGIFWLIGAGMMVGALQMARWRAAIAVASGRCLVVQVGLFGEKRETWEPGELAVVQVGPSGMEINDKPVMQLQFVPRTGKIFGVLSARDVPELEWLATKLTKALGLASDLLTADIETQPADSDVQCQQRPDGLSISVPRQAWGKGPGGWWIMAFVWNAFIWTLIVGVVFLKSTSLAELLFPLAIMSIFAIIGLVLIGVALHMSIRRAEIAFANGRLLVLEFGLSGTRRHQWGVEELSAIRAGNSGASINKRQLMQLQIVPRQGKTVSLLTGRDDRELGWVATTLRRATNVPAEMN